MVSIIVMFLVLPSDVAADKTVCKWPANASHIECDMDLGRAKEGDATSLHCVSVYKVVFFFGSKDCDILVRILLVSNCRTRTFYVLTCLMRWKQRYARHAFTLVCTRPVHAYMPHTYICW